MTGIFADLRGRRFDLIVGDPPWRFDAHSDKGLKKSPQAHYACMSLGAIKALPVDRLASDNSSLLLWTCAPLLDTGFDVIAAWGFRYCSRLGWRKKTANGLDRMGGGYVVRTIHEDVLIAKRGTPDYAAPFPSLIDGLAREHSRKPDEFYAAVERFAPHARKLDLFARQSRRGWATWGNEARKFDGAA